MGHFEYFIIYNTFLVITSGALALVLWYGGKLVHDKKITTGILASFLMYTLQVAMAFGFLSSLYGDFMQGTML